MDWTALVQTMVRVGFSPGEAVVMTVVVAQLVVHTVTMHRLKVRSEQAARARDVIWKTIVAEKADRLARLMEHERRFHGVDPEPQQN